LSGISLFTAVTAALTASIVLTAVLLYLSRLPRSDRALQLWTLAYGFYALRQAVNLAAVRGWPDLLAMGDCFLVLFAVLLLAGSLRFLGRDIPVVRLTLGTAAIVAWVFAARQLELSFLWRTMPPYTAAASALLVTAAAFWRQGRLETGVGHRLVAAIFMLWGAHTLDYPLLRPLTQYAGFGFLVTSGLALVLALSLIIITQRRQQLIAEASMSRLQRSEGELRESEARFRSMADTMPALLYITDSDGGCRFVNKTWLDYTGRRLEDELGQGWMDMIHAEDRAVVIEQEAAAFDLRRPYSVTFRLKGSGERLRWFIDTGTPRFGPDGTFLGYIGTLVDVTEQRHLAEQLQQAQKMEAVGQLTGGVAHDFNNLLAIVLGNLDLLDERLPADSQLRSLVQDSLRAAERGAELTDRLLAFARRQPLKPELTDVNGLMAGMTSLLRRTLRGNIRIDAVLAGELWPVFVDASQLESALLNLAINARDAMPQGGRLTLRTAPISVTPEEAERQPDLPAGDHVEIRVDDTGIGMPAEVLARAFEPFFTTKQMGRGSGLGLSMVYGFVKQSGGRISIDSAPGRGTRVRLVLPRAESGIEPAAAPPAPVQAPGNGELILLVEDDPSVRQLASGIVAGLGYRLIEAPDGPAALAVLAESGEVDLLVSDVMLPRGMNGFELARRARQLQPGLRVLFMSGYAESAMAEAGAGLGEIDLIHKPFRKADLAARLRRTLSQPAEPDRAPSMRAG
jgi:PAS domain S-box-containing protein